MTNLQNSSDTNNDLSNLFLQNSKLAITKSKELICQSSNFATFDQFSSYYKNHSRSCKCCNDWTEQRLAIHCFTCMYPNSFLCLPCFLNGNHEGHEYIIEPASRTNCSCGDKFMMNPSGFCHHHDGEDSEELIEKSLDQNLNSCLLKIFKSAFESIFQNRLSNKPLICNEIFNFIISFIRYGDGFRRVITKCLTEEIPFEQLILDITNYSHDFNQQLRNLCGLLITDTLFAKHFTKITYNFISNVQYSHSESNAMQLHENVNIWSNIWYHAFKRPMFEYNVKENHWDWISFAINFFNLIKKRFDLLGVENFSGTIFLETEIIYKIGTGTEIQPIEETQIYFDRLMDEVFSRGNSTDKNNTIITTSYKNDQSENHYLPIYRWFVIFNYVFNAFYSKPALDLTHFFELLNSAIDITSIFDFNKNKIAFRVNENDDLIKSYIQSIDNNEYPEMYYQSFHNGGSVLFTYPLYDTFVSLFRVDDSIQLKMAKILIQPEYQNLRIKLCIITIKKIVSLIAHHESLIPRNNHALLHFLDMYYEPGLVHLLIPNYFPVFQLLLGLNANSDEFNIKDFFAFEMGRELGLFDDFSDKNYEYEDITEIKKKIFYNFLYFSLLVEVERKLFFFEPREFAQEQIIFALAKGINKIESLTNSYSHYIIPRNKDTMGFDDILHQVSKVSSNENEKLYRLRDDIDWKTISGINFLKDQKILLNEKIKKNPDELLNMPEFCDEDDFFFSKLSPDVKITLKDFVMTPAVLAVVFFVLNSNDAEIDLNDHLALNILLMATTFSTENNECSLEINQIEYESLPDLIFNLRKQVFKSNNELKNKNNLKQFLQIKFINKQSGDSISIIDLITKKNKIGQFALKKISEMLDLQIELPHTTDISKETKKRRAVAIKQQIMSQFNQQIQNNIPLLTRHSSRNLSDLNASSDTFQNEKEVCSVCSTTRQNEVLSYPLYIYRTKLPFVFDKPVHVKGNIESSGIPIDTNEFEFYFNDDDYVSANFAEEEERLNNEINELENSFNMIARFHMAETAQDQLNLQRLQQIKYALFAKKMNVSFFKTIYDHKIEYDSNLRNKQFSEENDRPKSIGWNYVIQFGICQHSLHEECVTRNPYKCPIDRAVRNGFLPSLYLLNHNQIYDQNDLRIEIKNSILLFIQNYLNFFNSSEKVVKVDDLFYKKDVDLFIELIKSLSSLICTYEIRLRNLPDCLDSNKVFLLSRNLFLVVWYAYRIYNRPPLHDVSFAFCSQNNVEEKMTVFQRFIKKLIENDLIIDSNQSEEEFLKIFNEFHHNFTGKSLYLFLKRVCLAESFFIDNDINNSIEILDWDEVLSVKSLVKRYQVKNLNELEIVFKPFMFINLPKDYLKFYEKPFNFPVQDTLLVLLFNLIDYNQLIDNYDVLETIENTNQLNSTENGQINSPNNSNSTGINQSNEIENLTETEQIIENDPYARFKNNDRFLFLEGKVRQSELLLEFGKKYSRKVFPTVLLYISCQASQLVVIDQDCCSEMKTFYMDKYGAIDIGYQRNQPLILNEQRYEKFIDEILSGEFANNLEPLFE